MDDREPDLIRRAARGEPDALHELTDAHARHLFNVAYALTGRVPDAEDLVQETLVVAIGSLKRFAGRSSFRTWLVGILARQAAYARRRSRRGSPRSVDGVAEPETMSGEAGADAKMDVASALAGLSDEHREVLVLRELEGMSYEEIAEALGGAPWHRGVEDLPGPAGNQNRAAGLPGGRLT